MRTRCPVATHLYALQQHNDGPQLPCGVNQHSSQPSCDAPSLARRAPPRRAGVPHSSATSARLSARPVPRRAT